MGGDASAPEEAGGGQDPGAGANRAESAGVGICGDDVVEHTTVLGGSTRTRAAGDDERIETLGAIRIGPIDADAQARSGPQALQFRTDDLKDIPPARPSVLGGQTRGRQDLERADDVEQLNAREGDHRDPPRE